MADEKIMLVNRGSQHAIAADKFWKEILPEGTYTHPVPIKDPDAAREMLASGHAVLDDEGEAHQIVPAPLEKLQQYADTFAEAKKLGLKVHFADGHNNKSSTNLGWWEDMKVLLPDDVRKLGVTPRHERPALWGVVDVPNPEIAAKIGKEIQDVSAYIVPAGHPELSKANPDGTLVKLAEGISHVAATPKPVISDQVNFVPIAADLSAPVGFEIDPSKPLKPATPTASAVDVVAAFKELGIAKDAQLGKVGDAASEDELPNAMRAFMKACDQVMYSANDKGTKVEELKKCTREFMRMMDGMKMADKESEMSAEATAELAKKESKMDAATLSVADVEAKLGFAPGTFTQELSVAALDKHPRFVELSAAIAAEKEKAKTAETALAMEKGIQRLNQIKTRITVAQKTGRLNKAMADKRLADIPDLSAADWPGRAARVEAQLDVVEELSENSVVPLDPIVGPPRGTATTDTTADDDKAIRDAGLSYALPKKDQKEQ